MLTGKVNLEDPVLVVDERLSSLVSHAADETFLKQFKHIFYLDKEIPENALVICKNDLIQKLKIPKKCIVYVVGPTVFKEHHSLKIKLEIHKDLFSLENTGLVDFKRTSKIAPLLAPTTYCGLMDYIIGTESGYVCLDKKYKLLNDVVYEEIKHMKFQKACKKLQQLSLELKSISEWTVERVVFAQQMQQKLPIHIKIAERIKKYLDDGFSEYQQRQQTWDMEYWTHLVLSNRPKEQPLNMLVINNKTNAKHKQMLSNQYGIKVLKELHEISKLRFRGATMEEKQEVVEKIINFKNE